MLKSTLKIIALILLLVASCTIVHANSKGLQRQQEAQRFGNETKVAVVVGVNTYDTISGLRPLQYAVTDASALKKVLEKQGYSVRLLTNQQANSSYILDAIRQAGKTLDRNQGTLIFAFSGHGFARGNSNYLASYGTVKDDLASSALPMNKIIAAIKKTGARRGVMFIDACRDNPATAGSKSISNASFVHQQSEGLQILYSTKFGEVSWETPKLGHGVFSYFLQQALNGKAADSNGLISFNLLKQYVQKQVAGWTFSNLGKTQRPFSAGENYGVFVLGGKNSTAIQSEEVIINLPVVQNTQTQSPSKPVKIATNRIPPQQNPAQKKERYIDHGDGTVTDTKTRLMWKKCSEGQYGKKCQGKAKRFKWKEAMQHSKLVNFAGFDDWRMPSYDELKSLVYCEVWKTHSWGNSKYCKTPIPTINSIIFPNTQKSGYWLPSIRDENSGDKQAEMIRFDDGTYYYGKIDSFIHDNREEYYKRAIRLVRNK